MSSVWSSQGVVLATAVAVSGTMVLLLLCREKAVFLENTISAGGSHQKSGKVLRSCLSSGKKDGQRLKKVRFSGDVKDSSVKTDEYMKSEREVTLHNHISFETQTVSFNDEYVDKNLTTLMEFSN